MDRLRPRQRPVFSGFTKAEIEKMEKLLKESKQPMDKEFFQKIGRSFNYSSGRAGKPIVKWTEVQSWFCNRQMDHPYKVASSIDASKDDPSCPKGEKVPDLSKLEFEARSSKDGAWYDVDMFLCHRFLPSSEAFVLDLLDLGLRRMNGSM